MRRQYGHTMMWWDRLAGTYKSPEDVRLFNHSRDAKVQGGSWYAVPEAAAPAAAGGAEKLESKAE